MRIDDKGSRGMLDGIRRAQKRKRPTEVSQNIYTHCTHNIIVFSVYRVYYSFIS